MCKLKKILCIFMSLCLFTFLPFRGYLSIESYADDAITQNPLFIPITSLVTAVALGTGIVAKNSSEAISGANQLIQNTISNIKSSEIEKSEADSNYDSPYRVINGGQPEKPNNSNKNGKWVALGAGSLASSEIWANKDAIISAMQEINKLNGYSKVMNQLGTKNVSETNLISTSNASGIALQLAQYDSKLNTQFTAILNSDVFNNKLSEFEMNKDDLVYAVNFIPTHLALKDDKYPKISVSCIDSSEFSKIRLMYDLGFNTKSGNESSSMFAYSYSFYYLTEKWGSDAMKVYSVLNDDDASVRIRSLQFTIAARYSNENPSVTYNDSYYQDNIFYARNPNRNTLSDIAYVGFKWANDNPWQFTNNVYNVNQTFDVNFPDWLQDSISLLGQQLDAIRLGITTIQPSWNPTQEQIQSGLSPQNVINQYINNYENPEYIPEDEPVPDPNPNPNPNPSTDPAEEYKPDTTFLDNFMLPSTLTTKFPFCIPYDVARALSLFDTNLREAPRWECELHYGTNTYLLVIDLSRFNDIAAFLRQLEYILFVVGLAVGTRSLIRG